jgi:hypothetical protein
MGGTFECSQWAAKIQSSIEEVNLLSHAKCIPEAEALPYQQKIQVGIALTRRTALVVIGLALILCPPLYGTGGKSRTTNMTPKQYL